LSNFGWSYEFTTGGTSRKYQGFCAADYPVVSITPYRTDAQVLGKQLLRCGTSVAANYRAVCRARLKAEFIARIGIVAEEADEVILWMELLTESGVIKPERTEALLKEAKELAAILTASQQTARKSA